MRGRSLAPPLAALAPLLPLLLLPLPIACAGERAAEPPRRVFLVTFDTLRADHLGAYGYRRATSPRFDALAEGGVLFERAIAQWPKTGASFASMFTGRYPQTTGLLQRAALRVPAEYLTLPELFQEAGYTTVAVVSNPVLGAELGWDEARQKAEVRRYLEIARREYGLPWAS